MAELKTKPTKEKPESFFRSIEPDMKKKDSFALLELFKKATGEKPIMWGTSIVGFGKYHYKSERSAQEGDWPLVGFSPRKKNLTLYLMGRGDDYTRVLKKLGKHKTSGGCLYINKLADVDLAVLARLVKQCFSHNRKIFGQVK